MRAMRRLCSSRLAGGLGESSGEDTADLVEPHKHTCLSWRLALTPARCIMCELPPPVQSVGLTEVNVRCNDTLFPSTAQPRQNGDTSFTPRQHGRGCCGSATDHEHATPTSSFHDSAFEPQVLLIDAGCEWKDYASDITRTLPVGNGGKFTERAGHIYDLVLKMQKVRLRRDLAMAS